MEIENYELGGAGDFININNNWSYKLRQGEKFLKGPIPWLWIEMASSLPGRTLHVGIAIWHLSNLNKSNTVKLSSKVLKGMGVDRHAKSRGLKELELAGLVKVERNNGQNPLVTIIENISNN